MTKKNISNIAIHTITNRPWTTEQCIEEYSKAGIGGITFWRYSFEGRDPKKVGEQARNAGLNVVSESKGKKAQQKFILKSRSWPSRTKRQVMVRL